MEAPHRIRPNTNQKAQAQGFDRPITAYLCSASIKARTGIGVVFGHNRKDQYGRFGDGHLIRTSDVIKVEREGRFWVMTTENSRYVLATFQRGNGRASLREFLRLSRGCTTSPREGYSNGRGLLPLANPPEWLRGGVMIVKAGEVICIASGILRITTALGPLLQRRTSTSIH